MLRKNVKYAQKNLWIVWSTMTLKLHNGFSHFSVKTTQNLVLIVYWIVHCYFQISHISLIQDDFCILYKKFSNVNIEELVVCHQLEVHGVMDINAESKLGMSSTYPILFHSFRTNALGSIFLKFWDGIAGQTGLACLEAATSLENSEFKTRLYRVGIYQAVLP